MFKPERIAWVLAVLYFIFNLGFFSYDYDMDGAVFSLYLEAVKSGASPLIMFHTHHMVYEPLGYFFWNLLLWAGASMRSVLALQLFDLVLSALSLAVFALSLMLIDPNRKWPALLCTLGLGFSFSYWFFSVQPGELTLAILFLNLGLFFMARTTSGNCDTITSGQQTLTILLLGVFSALAFFGHIMHGLFFLPVLVFGFRFFQDLKWPARILKLSVIVLAAGCIVSIPYLIVFFAGPGRGLSTDLPAAFIKWVLGNAGIETPFGYQHSYWESAVSGPGGWPAGMAWAFFWKQDRTFEPNIWGAFKVFALLAIAFFVGNFVWQYFKNLHKRRIMNDVIIAWVVPGVVFSAFWASNYFEQKTYLLPALWAMIFLGLPGSGSSLKKNASILCLILAVASLLVVNFEAKILPDSRPENAVELVVAEQIGKSTAPESLIIISGASRGYNIGKVYIPYFSHRGTIVLDWVLGKPADGRFFPYNLGKKINDSLAAGKPLYLLSDVFQAPALEELSRHHGIDQKDLADFWSRYHPQLVLKLEDGQELYRLSPGP